MKTWGRSAGSARRNADPSGRCRAVGAQAASLIRDGRRLDAIDVLTASNREHRDDDVERQLVGLRNVAFDDLDKTPGAHRGRPPRPISSPASTASPRSPPPSSPPTRCAAASCATVR